MVFASSQGGKMFGRGNPHRKAKRAVGRDTTGKTCKSVFSQLNSLQILEQLAPLELAKQHLSADIIDILEYLGKANNIPFNQLYYYKPFVFQQTDLEQNFS